jgi:cobyrinic acid a,c-diamide synthase
VESQNVPRLVIAGISSGAGKTTLMLALCAAFRQRGLRVATFKCGPDYLDPGYHEVVSGQPCHNLDTWMMGSRAVQDLFVREARGADIALIFTAE